MTDAKQAWNEVGDRLGALALKLKLHLEQESSEHEEHDEEHSEELLGALDRLGEAFEDVFEAAENAARDEAIRSDIGAVARNTIDALSATFGELTDEIRSQTRR